MSIQIRVGDILDEVLFQLHLPDFGASEFVTNTSAVRLLKSSGRRLSGLLTRLYGDAFFAETATLTTVPDFDLVSLPDNLATVRTLHWIKDENTAVELTRANMHTYLEKPQSWGSNVDSWWTCQSAPTYRIESNVIVLVPKPTEAYTLRLNYTTGIFIPDLSLEEGGMDYEFEGQIGWAEWMVADICYAITKREQKDPTNFLNDLTMYEQQMKDHIANRDRFSTYQVRDARGASLDPLRRRYYRGGW